MKIKGMMAAAAVGCAFAVTAPLAHADDVTGTVMARTQRTSGPNLASQYSGPEIQSWWKPGVAVDLQCSVHGQAVKGFFSQYLPNGGWDDLWYRTPSGDYIADVDIETHTDNSVTPPC